jgi:predicted short-subunit dehydrogenase-like oxidoreductase (DUF2520 family)
LRLPCRHYTQIDHPPCYSAVVNRVRTISFVGAGALASGLAKLLHAQGFRIAEIIARPVPASQRKAAVLARSVGAASTTLENATLSCDVLWLAVPDEAVEEVSRVLAGRAELPPVILHASGALSSLALSALAGRGVHTGSAHPMMTFVGGEPPSLKGAWFAVEGSAAAVRAARAMARKLGAHSFTIEPGSKILYHTFGAMLSPMLATELEAAERIGLRAGISAREVRRIMEPIVLRTVQNVLRNGAGKSFSGPLARGDVGTVAGHLESLGNSPESLVYRALMEYATGTLPVKRGVEMKELLETKKLLRERGARARK